MELIFTNELLEHIGQEYEMIKENLKRQGFIDIIPFNQFLNEELRYMSDRLREGGILVKN